MTTYSLAGQCKDSNGNGVASAIVHVFLTADDTKQGTATADGSGNYSVTGMANQGPLYVVAYHANSPDIFGTTLNTLMGVAEAAPGASGSPMGLLLTITYP